MQSHWLGIVALLLSAIPNAEYARADEDDIIESTFRNAVVKIDVSSNSPVIKDGVNICNSQGTGFLVSSSYVATAGHVVEVDPECGQPVILLKSRTNNVVLQARVIASNGDIALLKVEPAFPASMCALGLLNHDVYDSKGYRFGIPGQLMDPRYLPIKIGAKDTEFSPLVPLTPTPVELGESGGPIVYYFNVVGILKAKHQQYIGQSFMITGSLLQSLMEKNDVKVTGEICNPVKINMPPPGTKTIIVQPNKGFGEAAQKLVSAAINSASSTVRTTSAAGVQVSGISASGSFLTEERISISAEDRIKFTQVCRTIKFGPRICTTEPTRIPGSGSQTARKVASDIQNDASTRLWNNIVGQAPVP